MLAFLFMWRINHWPKYITGSSTVIVVLFLFRLPTDVNANVGIFLFLHSFVAASHIIFSNLHAGEHHYPPRGANTYRCGGDMVGDDEMLTEFGAEFRG